MDNNQNSQEEKKKVAYVCDGTCHAEISQEEYDAGLKTCGEKSCTHFGKPFRKVENGEEHSAKQDNS